MTIRELTDALAQFDPERDAHVVLFNRVRPKKSLTAPSGVAREAAPDISGHVRGSVTIAASTAPDRPNKRSIRSEIAARAPHP
jgi:hypothetical protein